MVPVHAVQSMLAASMYNMQMVLMERDDKPEPEQILAQATAAHRESGAEASEARVERRCKALKPDAQPATRPHAQHEIISSRFQFLVRRAAKQALQGR